MLVAMVPFVVLAVRALVDDAAAPSGDVALIAVRVGDVGPRTPLLGSYGRFGFNHPGPLLFYALALPYRLFGGRFAGIEIGALVLGALSVTAMLRVAHRRGGRTGLLWTLAVVAVLLHGVGPSWLLDPWEPHALPLVGAAMILLAFDAVAGRAAALPPAAAAASLLAQSWATLLPLAVVMSGWAVTGLIVRAGRGPRDRRAVAGSFVVTAGLLVVLWAPPLLQQVSRPNGNLAAMLRALDAPEPPLGAVDGWRAVATELGHRASWLGFPQRLDGLSPTLDLGAAPTVPVAAVALVVGLVLAVRRRASAPEAWRLGATALVAIAAATFAMSRQLGPVFVWIPQWLRIIGMTATLAAGWCLATGLPAAARDRARPVAEAVLALVAVAVLALVTIDGATFHRSDDPLGDAIRGLARQAAPIVADVDGAVLVTSAADANLALGGDDVGIEVLVLELEHRGVGTAVDDDLEHQFGPERARPGRAVVEVRLARADDDAAAGDGFRLVAEKDPLRPGQRAARASILQRAGLAADASDSDLLRLVSSRPELRRDAARLRAIPDLPVLQLLIRDREVVDDR
jgi:hypothetical protein